VALKKNKILSMLHNGLETSVKILPVWCPLAFSPEYFLNATLT
jgi:hypothetical protein